MEMNTPPDTLVVNGSPCEIPGPLSVADLLARLGVAGRPVVVELDETAVFPRDYASVIVRPGSRVEIVTLAAGG